MAVAGLRFIVKDGFYLNFQCSNMMLAGDFSQYRVPCKSATEFIGTRLLPYMQQ